MTRFCDLVIKVEISASYKYPLATFSVEQCKWLRIEKASSLRFPSSFFFSWVERFSVIAGAAPQSVILVLSVSLLSWYYSLQTSLCSDPGSASLTSEDCSECFPLRPSLCGRRFSYMRSVPLNTSVSSSWCHWFSTGRRLEVTVLIWNCVFPCVSLKDREKEVGEAFCVFVLSG